MPVDRQRTETSFWYDAALGALLGCLICLFIILGAFLDHVGAWKW